MHWTPIDVDSTKRKKNDQGYFELWLPDHPNNVDGWVRMHRVVYENFLGRYLLPEEVIHHVNEVKTDNRIENLFLCSEQEHTLFHRSGKKHKKSSRQAIRRKKRNVRYNRGPDGKFTGGNKN